MVIRDGVAKPLTAAGFERVGQKRRWARPTAELLHIVVVGYRHGSYDVEFLLGCPPASVILTGAEPAEPSDPEFALALGAAYDLRRPARLSGFRLRDGMGDDEVAKLAENAREDAAAIAAWLGRFQTRADLRRHLVETRGTGFAWPTGDMGLVDLTAAALAVLDHSPDADELVETVATAFARWPDDERVRRLRAAARTS